MKRIFLLLSLPLFISCQSLPEADPQLTTSPIYEDVSDKFSGSHSRQFQDEVLTFTVDQTHREGGLDVGLSDLDLAPAIVAELPEDVWVCSAYDVSLSGEGRWWAGPKISVILPDTIWAGSTYRNYKIRFHDWWQYWSVRQDFRSTGILNIKPILEFWSEHGLPENRRFDGVKANIETYGPIKGSGRLAIDVSTSKSQKLNCPH